MKSFVPAAALLVGCCLTPIVGCGGRSTIDTEKARGTVQFEGKPVANAQVMFSPVEGGTGSPAYASTNERGEFVLQTLQGAVDAGTTPGDYKVTVSKVEMVSTGKTEKTPEGKEEKVQEPKEVLPRKYKFSIDTPLEATIKEGEENVFDFKLEK